MKVPKRKPRTHLKALNAERLKQFGQLVQAANIPNVAKLAVMQSVRAAANKDAEKAEVIIESLDLEERLNVQGSVMGYAQTLGNVGNRGRMGLLMIPEEEWNALLDDDA